MFFMSGFSLIQDNRREVDMQKSTIWAISLLTVGIGIIFYAIGYERQPVTLGTLVKPVVIEKYIAEKYGDEFGWNVRTGRKVESEEKLELFKEAYEQMNSAGMDLAAYDGEFVNHYVFPLLPICQENGEERGVELIVYEHNGEFIGDVMSSLNTVGGPRKTISKEEWLAEDHCK
jgi:hypothetical protein